MKNNLRDEIKVGWSHYGLVELRKQWCVICAKNRWHETVEAKTVCLACCNVIEEEPKFQIERFIKEGV